MTRRRVSPFEPGSAERILHDRYRRSLAAARAAERARDLAAAEAAAFNAKADKYAEALRALGHGDKLPERPQAALPAPRKETE